jgi:hypothetical protein
MPGTPGLSTTTFNYYDLASASKGEYLVCVGAIRAGLGQSVWRAGMAGIRRRPVSLLPRMCATR